MASTRRPVDRLAFTVTEAAEAFGVSSRFIWILIKSGELASFRLGRRVLIPAACLTDLIASASKEGAA